MALLPTVEAEAYTEPVFAQAYATYAGENHLVAEASPATPRADGPPLVPEAA